MSVHRAVRSQRLWLTAPILGAVLLGLFEILPAGSVEQSIVYDILGLAMAGVSLAGVAIYRPAGRRAWLLLVAGQLAFVIGDVIWTAYLAQDVNPFPSVADVAYLAGYPLMALGLGSAIRRRVGAGDRAGLLDAAILATGVSIVWWSVALGPIVAASDPEPVSFWISAAYPLGDLLLIGMALALLTAPGARSISFRLLVLSLAALLAADLGFGLQNLEGSYQDGGPVDLAWLVAYVLFATAAVHPSMAGLFDPRPVAVAPLGPIRFGLLAGAMLVGPTLLILERADGEPFVLVAGAATGALSLLVLLRLAGMVAHLSRDIERRIELEAQLSFQALHDPLTGLPNRRQFIEAVTRSIESGRGTALLFIDLDDFKDVNDGLGHDAGDELLVAIAARLAGLVRPSDLPGRIGGDEFAVLLRGDAGTTDAEGLASRLLSALEQPLLLEGQQVAASASIGVAVLAPGNHPAVDDLLRRADVAMYHAKAHGKHRFTFYRPEMDGEAGPTSPNPPKPHVRRAATAATT